MSKLYGSEAEDDPGFRSQSERDLDLQGEQGGKPELPGSGAASTPSPKSSVKEEKSEGSVSKGYEGSSNLESDNSSISNSEDERGLRSKFA